MRDILEQLSFRQKLLLRRVLEGHLENHPNSSDPEVVEMLYELEGLLGAKGTSMQGLLFERN